MIFILLSLTQASDIRNSEATINKLASSTNPWPDTCTSCIPFANPLKDKCVSGCKTFWKQVTTSDKESTYNIENSQVKDLLSSGSNVAGFFTVASKRTTTIGNINVINCRFYNLKNKGAGSAFYVKRVTNFMINGCYFEFNDYADRNAPAVGGKPNLGCVIAIETRVTQFALSDSSFLSNGNGCVNIKASDTCSINSTKFINNSQIEFNGGVLASCLYLESGATIQNCMFEKNQGNQGCSMIFISNQLTTIDNCTIKECSCANNGLIVPTSSSINLNMNEVYIYDNLIPADHGEIEIKAGTAVLTSCSFNFERSTSNSCSILVSGLLTIENNCFFGSTTGSLGLDNIYFNIAGSGSVTSNGNNKFNIQPNINIQSNDMVSNTLVCPRIKIDQDEGASFSPGGDIPQQASNTIANDVPTTNELANSVTNGIVEHQTSEMQANLTSEIIISATEEIVPSKCIYSGSTSTSIDVPKVSSEFIGSEKSYCEYNGYSVPVMKFSGKVLTDVYIQYCRFTNNKGAGNSGSFGGSIFSGGGSSVVRNLTVLDCEFNSCSPPNGNGGLFILGNKLDNGIFKNLNITDCHASQDGDIIHVQNDCKSLEFENLNCIRLKQSRTSSCISLCGSPIVSLKNCNFTDSSQIFRQKFAIASITTKLSDCEVSLESCYINQCQVSDEASIIQLDKPFERLTISKCEFFECGKASSANGVILFNRHTTASYKTTITDTVFKHNLMSSIKIDHGGSMISTFTGMFQRCTFIKGTSESASISSSSAHKGAITFNGCCFYSSDPASSKLFIRLTGFELTFDSTCCIDGTKDEAINSNIVSADNSIYECQRCQPGFVQESMTSEITPSYKYEEPVSQTIEVQASISIPTPIPPEQGCNAATSVLELLENRNFDGRACAVGYYTNIGTGLADGITIIKCIFSNYKGGSADFQGCIVMGSNGGAPFIKLENSKFINCTAPSAGSALHLRKIDDVKIFGCDFIECKITTNKQFGSAISLYRENKNIKLEKCLFERCQSGAFALVKQTRADNANTVEKIINCTIIDCQLQFANHACVTAGTNCVLENIMFINNQGLDNVAVKIDTEKEVTLKECKVLNCVSKSGIVTMNDKENNNVKVIGCLFDSNEAPKGVVATKSLNNLAIENTIFISNGSTSIIAATGTNSLAISISCFSLAQGVAATSGIHVNSLIDVTVDAETKFQGDQTTVISPNTLSQLSFIADLVCPFVSEPAESLISLNSENQQQTSVSTIEATQSIKENSITLNNDQQTNKASEIDQSATKEPIKPGEQTITKEENKPDDQTSIVYEQNSFVFVPKSKDKNEEDDLVGDQQGGTKKPGIGSGGVIGIVIGVVVVVIVIGAVAFFLFRNHEIEKDQDDEHELFTETTSEESISDQVSVAIDPMTSFVGSIPEADPFNLEESSDDDFI